MSIVLFEQDALGWSTRVFFVRSVSVDLLSQFMEDEQIYSFLIVVRSHVTASIGDIWMCI